MAKQIQKSGNSTIIEREDGDACPRLCPGTLVLLPNGPGENARDMLKCGVCEFTWDRRYTIPASGEVKSGNAPPMALLPDSIVLSITKAKFDHQQVIVFPNPVNREQWGELSADTRKKWLKETREQLTPVWAEVAEWFSGFAYASKNKDQMNATNAITEVAIPALQHCQDHNGHNHRRALKTLEAVVKEDE